jgi:tRNA A-37 threonylcarbamoyl transferase component Bud32
MRCIAHYEILKVLGQGAFGEVYQARHTLTDQVVVLKSLPAMTCLDAAARQRLQEQTVATIRLNHPNIVRVLDLFEEQGRTYLAVEYVDGPSLGKQLAQGPPPPQRTAQLVARLADAVQTAHQHGVLHGDLRPANVLLTSDGQPKLTDFQLPAAVLEQYAETTPCQGVGAPSYMAPEQLRGHPVPASDVYGLGAILYESLTGQPPFRGATVIETLSQVLEQTPTTPHALNPQVPRELEKICLKCLSKDPSQRYSSAADVARDLQRYLEDQPRGASPPAAGASPAPGAAPPAPDKPCAARPPSVRSRAVEWVGQLFGRGRVEHLKGTRGRTEHHPETGAPVPQPTLANEMPGETIDPVMFSVTAATSLQPGTACIIDVWAHFEQQRAEVLERARQAAGEEVRGKSKGPVPVARGSTLAVRLKVEDLVIDEPEDTILWDGSIGNATFAVRAPAGTTPGGKRGLATIHASGLQIARLHFLLQVGQPVAQVQPLPCDTERHRHAFASYAHDDRDAVLARIQGIQKAAPNLEIFLDVFSLRSGQYWERELWDVIPRNDVFYLFWSAHARRSPWVEKEWRCALQTKGLDFIDPVPLVSPQEVPPPPELAGKHFDDWVLAFIKGKGGPKRQPPFRGLANRLSNLMRFARH